MGHSTTAAGVQGAGAAGAAGGHAAAGAVAGGQATGGAQTGQMGHAGGLTGSAPDVGACAGGRDCSSCWIPTGALAVVSSVWFVGRAAPTCFVPKPHVSENIAQEAEKYKVTATKESKRDDTLTRTCKSKMKEQWQAQKRLFESEDKIQGVENMC